MNRLSIVVALLAMVSLLSAAHSGGAPISYEQKRIDIESLRSFEEKNGPLKSEPEPVRQKQQKVEFVCDVTSEHNCEMQKVMHRAMHREKPTFISEGKYKVEIFFSNDRDFPDKFVEEEHFESISREEEALTLTQIFEHYLGNDSAIYSPKIINVNESTVGITLLVSSSEELNVFLDDQKVIGIYHIGNNRTVPEGY